MPNYALIIKETGLAVDFVDAAEKRFDVHEDFMWVNAPDVIEEGCDYQLNSSTGAVEKIIYGNPEWDMARESEYHEIGYGGQLDQLWHDMDSGIIPGKESSQWYLNIKAIKEKYPKP